MPRSGPSYSEITANVSPELQFDVVNVTATVTAASRLDEHNGFSSTITGAPPENTSTLASGDILAITVWENIDQGLLSPQGIGAALLPKVMVDEKSYIFVPYVGFPAARLRNFVLRTGRNWRRKPWIHRSMYFRSTGGAG